ncbi:hypothetical protein N7492_002065 [Penicillium capsulatum]|uniref:Uncharacterized protein n=1 Tax=Penicillium capsulatum TaxID=69766 RepID=A0A9W9LVC1_9EURO|nr:hypothetical protein N7492_002065 [Penicillium capsulatum]
MFWSSTNEQLQASEQIKVLNRQIRAKNAQRNLRASIGCIDIGVLESTAKRLNNASLEFGKSGDTKSFNFAKRELQKSIKTHKWPETWAVEWDQFLDYHTNKISQDSLSKVKVPVEKNLEPLVEKDAYSDDESYPPSEAPVDEDVYSDNGSYPPSETPVDEDVYSDNGSYPPSETPVDEDVYSDNGSYPPSEAPVDEDVYSDNGSYPPSDAPVDEDVYSDNGSYPPSETPVDEDVYSEDGSYPPSETPVDEDVYSDNGSYPPSETPVDEDVYSEDGSYPPDKPTEDESGQHARSHLPKWKKSVSLHTIRQNAQKAYGGYGFLLSVGSSLGRHKTKDGRVLVVLGYECQGKHIARVKPGDDNICSELEFNNPQDQDISCGREGRTSHHVKGIGLVAWAVDEKQSLDATKSLYPKRDTLYPDTLIWVHWTDELWTWESRESLRSIMCDLSSYEVDVIIYFVAVSQEADYQEKLAGERPIYPIPTTLEETSPRSMRSLTPEPNM